jgi:Domain of unknown function (DUF1707)
LIEIIEEAKTSHLEVTVHGPDNGPPDEAGLRVSDADRDAVVDQLAGHFQQGRLDLTEFQDRMDRAVRARTRGDLAGLLADLPQPVAAAPPPAGPGRRWPVPPPVLAFLAVAGGVILASIFAAAAHGYWPGGHGVSGHWVGGHGIGWHGGPGGWAPWWALWWLIPAAIVTLRVMWWRRARAAGRWQ